jgi:hypothetical protein
VHDETYFIEEHKANLRELIEEKSTEQEHFAEDFVAKLI